MEELEWVETERGDRGVAGLTKFTAIIIKQKMEFKTLEDFLDKTIKDDGYKIKEISDAEERLNIKFPEEIKYFYSKFGRNRIINGHNFLIPPKHLATNNEILIFYVENQACYRWFFKIEELYAGKTVVYGMDDNGATNLIAKNLEEFFIMQCVSNFPNAFFSYQMTYSYYNDNLDPYIKSIVGGSKVNTITSWNSRVKWFWKDKSCVAFTIQKEDSSMLYVKTDSEEILLKLIKCFRQKWEIKYSSKQEKNRIPRVFRYDDDESEFKEEPQKKSNVVDDGLPF